MDDSDLENFKMEGQHKTPKKERIGTGIGRLDELLNGGFPEGSINLVSGTPGSGKTIFCYHFISDGVNNGEKCLFLTSDDRVENIMYQADELGFDFQTAVDEGLLEFKFLDLDKPNSNKEMQRIVEDNDYSRVVLDSLTPIAELPAWVSDVHEVIPSETRSENKRFPTGSTPATRMHVRRVIKLMNENNCTALITSEIPEGSRALSRDGISGFMVDGVILMDLDATMDRRKLTIRKMRATQHTLKPQNIEITTGGIKFTE